MLVSEGTREREGSGEKEDQRLEVRLERVVVRGDGEKGKM